MPEFRAPSDSESAESDQDLFVDTTMDDTLTLQQAMAEITRLQALIQTKRPRSILPDPEQYDGEEMNAYPQFESKLYAKLQVDEAALGGPYERLWYAFGRLKGKAAQRLHPWMEGRGKDRDRITENTIKDFFEQMRFFFADAHRRVKANERLHNLYQGKKSFNEYLGEFEQLLLEAGGSTWEDVIKCGFLTNGLNIEMRQSIVSLQAAKTFVEYCRQLQKIADSLTEIDRIQRSRKGRGRQFTQYSRTAGAPNDVPPHQGPRDADAMDWAPAGAELNNLQRRAKWVPQDEIEKRRKERRCVRCGDPSHYQNRCPYRAPRRPPTKVSTIRSRSELAELEVDSSSEPETGKE
jgi:Retrotransposon gag protein